MGKTIYLLRHAQSRHNAHNLLEVDTDLSELGEHQARSIDCDKVFDTVVCSPLRRCRRTLELSGISYNNITIEPLAREWVTSLSDTLEGEMETDEPKKNLYKRLKELRIKLHALLETTESLLVVCHYWIIVGLTSMDENGEFTQKNIYPNNAEIIQYELK